MGIRATAVVLFWVLLSSSVPVANSHGQTTESAQSEGSSLQVSMAGGYSSVTGIPIGQQVLLQVRQARRGARKGEDSLLLTSVHWSASAGFFPHGNEGKEVIWQAPDYACRTTISASSGVAEPPELAEVTSSSAAAATITLDTLYLVDIRMVIVNPVQTAYPYVGEQFHTRVLLCVCGEYEWGMYCGR